MIGAAVALALGAVTGPAVLVGGPTGSALDAAPAGPQTVAPLLGADDNDDHDDHDDHDRENCLRKKHPPKWCYNGLYLPPVVGNDEPGQSPYAVGGYVSAPPGELVAPLGGGYVSSPPGQAIPPVGDGYVSSPPGVALSPVG
jgi:hypothetical protein